MPTRDQILAALQQLLQPAPSHVKDTGQTNPVQPIPSHSQLQTGEWDVRADQSKKGMGFLGALARPDRRVSSEISVSSDEFGGAEYPTIVPTLGAGELDFLLNMPEDYQPETGPHIQHPWGIPQPIMRKALEFAQTRKAAGKPFFAQPGEERYDVLPQFRRKQ